VSSRALWIVSLGALGVLAYLSVRDAAAALRGEPGGDSAGWPEIDGYWPELGEGDAGGADAGGLVNSYILPGYYAAENAVSSLFGARLMEVSRAGIAEISRSEALRLTPYLDQAGYPTIGYGHKILPGESFGEGISPARADELLAKDLSSATAAVNSLVKVPLEQPQFDALVSLTFNIGAPALRSSTLLRLLNAGDYAGAQAQFGVWNKVRQGGVLVESRGLDKRRAQEAGLFGEGIV